MKYFIWSIFGAVFYGAAIYGIRNNLEWLSFSASFLLGAVHGDLIIRAQIRKLK